MPWKFGKRADGKISITLDNNVWNYLFDRGLDLAAELPSDRFALFITREVEIETEAIQSKDEKTALNHYIAQTIDKCHIITTSVFGFASEGLKKQRCGGFGQGTWQSETEQEFYAAIREQYLVGRPEKGSQLFDNEADAAVGAQSFSSIVLTCEKPSKTGPIRYAAENGGKVLYLRECDLNAGTLGSYVETLYAQIG